MTMQRKNIATYLAHIIICTYTLYVHIVSIETSEKFGVKHACSKWNALCTARSNFVLNACYSSCFLAILFTVAVDLKRTMATSRTLSLSDVNILFVPNRQWCACVHKLRTTLQCISPRGRTKSNIPFFYDI